ncbi:hypothetical protein D3C76_1309510 [compost metagenome]
MCSLAENTDDAGVRRRRVLARSVDIEKAQDDRFQSVLATIEIKEVFAGELVGGIGRQGIFWRVFADRGAFAVVAVDRRTGGINDSPYPRLAHGFTNIQRTDEVALVSGDRIVDRGLHRGHRRQMDHRGAVFHRPRDRRRVGDVPHNQRQMASINRQVG